MEGFNGGLYDTPIPPDKLDLYNAWLSQLPKQQQNSYDYDMQGAFLQGLLGGSNGHFPDTFKKPNHPTFSDQSIYNDVNGYAGGRWETIADRDVFYPSHTNLENLGAEQLRGYFERYEPNSLLMYGLGD